MIPLKYFKRMLVFSWVVFCRGRTTYPISDVMHLVLYSGWLNYNWVKKNRGEDWEKPNSQQTIGISFFSFPFGKARLTEVPQLKIWTKCVTDMEIQFCCLFIRKHKFLKIWYVALSLYLALSTGSHIFNHCNITLRYQNISVTISTEEARQHSNTIVVE